MQKLNYPDWANWIAQDQDGTWWVYEVEPLQHHKGWYENEVGRSRKICNDKTSKNWRLTLQRVDGTRWRDVHGSDLQL